MKQIDLRQVFDATQKTNFRYVCEKLTNATFPAVGESLTKVEVDEICDSGDWKVTIR